MINNRNIQLRGIGFLLSHRNPDNGVPAVNVQDMSGCWTTASAIETLLLNRYLPKKDLVQVYSMVEFLLSRHNPGEGWPISVGAQHTSTMATGHAIAALCLASATFHGDTALTTRIDDAIATALDWLHRVQTATGGWGIEPATDQGKIYSTMATCYALRGLLASGHYLDSSRDVQRGINYLISKVRPDGGWGQREGVSSDPANTARVVCTLLQSGTFDKRSSVVQRALSFILANKASWKINVESYVVSGAPGQVYFHANTPADVLECLVRCGIFGKEVRTLIKFFLDAQDDIKGFWYLQDQKEVDESICTWSTAEALAVLDFAHESYAEFLVHENAWRHLPGWPLAFATASLVAVFELFYILDVYSGVAGWWTGLSESWQQLIVGTVLGGLIIGVVANIISPSVRAFFIRIARRRFKD